MSVLVGRVAPDFKAAAVMEDNAINEHFHLKEYLAGRYGVIFFYPLDFTFVCPSELIAFDRRIPEFSQRNTAVLGISIDSEYTHLAWKNTPLERGGIGKIGYPLIADIRHDICRAYGVEAEEGVAYRGSFLVDQKGIVRHQVVNDMPLGRNIDEMLRMIDSLQFFEKNGEVCPAGWQKGKAAMTASPEGVASYLAEHSVGL